MPCFQTAICTFTHHGGVQGDLVIGTRGGPGDGRFRLDAGEAALFVSAVRIGAVREAFATAATRMELEDGMARMAALDGRPGRGITPFVCPFPDIAAFVDNRLMDRRFSGFMRRAMSGAAAECPEGGLGILASATVQARHGGLGPAGRIAGFAADQHGMTAAHAVLLAAALHLDIIRDGCGLLRFDQAVFEVSDGAIWVPDGHGQECVVHLEAVEEHVATVLLPRWTARRIAGAFWDPESAATAAMLAGVLASVLDTDGGDEVDGD